MITSAALSVLLVSAVCHAGWNALLKRTTHPRAASLLVLIGAGVIAALAMPLMPSSSVPRTTSGVVWSLAAGIGEGVYFFCLPRALAAYPLGAAYTVMRGFAMMLVWAVACTFLGEQLDGAALIGTACVLGAVMLASVRSVGELRWQPMPWAYGAAVGVAMYHLCYARAMQGGVAAPAVFAIAMAVATPLYALTYGRGLRRDLQQMLAIPGQARVVSWTAFFCALSFLLFLVGLQHTGAGVAIVVRSTSVVLAQFFAWHLGESIRWPQWCAVVLTIVGILCLELG